MARTKTNEIPHSLEAEEYVLGSILIEPDLANEYCGRLTINDFYHDRHKKIYQGVEYLYKLRKEVNVINLIETLKTFGYYENINEEYLFELTDSIPTTITTESYLEVLKDRSLERELYNKTKDIGSKVLKGEMELKELLALSEKQIMDIVNKQRTEDLRKVGTNVDKVFDIMERNRNKSNSHITGLDTGYTKLNNLTFGFQPGELIILAARPSVGKSALALNIGYHSALKDSKNVAFFSLEMSIEQLIMRLLSSASNVKLNDIKSGRLNEEDMAKVLNARVDLDEVDFYIDESTTTSLEDIKVKCRKLKRNNKLDFIIIDYLQLLTLGKDKKANRNEEVSTISRSLKLLALELGVPILALSQLNRSVDVRNSTQDTQNPFSNKKSGESRPKLSDLRESGSIEQDADIVMFLHRTKDQEDISNRSSRQLIEVLVSKNRQGKTGEFKLLFRGDYSTFENYTEKTDK